MTPQKNLTKMLKPCPLCGQSVGLYRLAGWSIIRCPCGLKIEKSLEPEELVVKWNQRHCVDHPEADALAAAIMADSQPTEQDLFDRIFG